MSLAHATHQRLPAASDMQAAWDLCKKRRRPHKMEPNVLVLGLLHGAHIGAARNATTMNEASDLDRLQAARLFAALQVKLAREPACGHDIPEELLDTLLASVPKAWAGALTERLR
jgi:hypothetical protein